MKKKPYLIFGILFLALLACGGWFYYQNLRGAYIPLKDPEKNIRELFEENEGENKTDFPLRLPEGFSISIFAKDIERARVLTEDSNETLLVSSLDGRVVAMPDKNNDGVADQNIAVIEGLNQPHGLAFHPKEKNKLYIAETNQVSTYDYNPENYKVSNKKKIIDLPSGGNHTTRTIIFNNEGKLLISIGSSCNVCNESDNRRAKVMIANDDGSDFRVYSSGLRNAVFMTVHPILKNAWVTEMGRDLIGDDIPPDEINILEEGKNYGWPRCYGKKAHDRAFDSSSSAANFCQGTVPSLIDIQAHSAPLGLTFFKGDGWKEEYKDDLLVAYHGSWNRSSPTGYKVVRMKLDEKGNFQGEEDFITGWLQGKEVLGRPVDILIQEDGSMYISDDKAGLVYKITGPKKVKVQ